MVALVAVAALLAHNTAWKHHVLQRTSRSVAATLTYDARPDGFSADVRNAVLIVQRRGSPILVRRLRSISAGTLTLTLRDVWGDREPEVVVRAMTCGNRCYFLVALAIPKTRHLFVRWFGHIGVSIQKNVIASRDERFFCFFTSCSGSVEPLQVFAVNAAGSRLVDVTRSRRALLRADAAMLHTEYLRGPEIGILAPLCAEQYLLGNRAHCDRVLPPKVRRQLVAWGYR